MNSGINLKILMPESAVEVLLPFFYSQDFPQFVGEVKQTMLVSF